MNKILEDIIELINIVFVSLSNNNLVVYRRMSLFLKEIYAEVSRSKMS